VSAIVSRLWKATFYVVDFKRGQCFGEAQDPNGLNFESCLKQCCRK